MGTKRQFAIFVMGVSGVGKSTIGKLLSQKHSLPFFDGDDFHPTKNKDKMARGEALNDQDRFEWLHSLNALALEQIKTNSCVIACSALKGSYRDLLKKGIETQAKWVFLQGDYQQVLARVNQRKGHFMPPALLKSQFETLEPPIDALAINIDKSPDAITARIIQELFETSEFGLLGLGVMGKSLARNLASKGISLSLFNRHVKGSEENVAANFIAQHDELRNAQPFDNLQSFIDSLQRPRKIMLMVNAGKAVDAVIEQLIPFLAANDVIIDGGNSHFEDTASRSQRLKKDHIFLLGTGISGGEDGALTGPSIMPGGDKKAYKITGAYLEKIAARDLTSKPCCSYIGKAGSGHYVKMVHNGIEYAEMQLLAEVYFILKRSGKNQEETAAILESWPLKTNSYLLEITIDILRKKEGDTWLLDKILDKSGNKGTGNWTTINAAQLGQASTMIPAALFARYLSAFKEERVKFSAEYPKNSDIPDIDSTSLQQAYQLARIVNHHQGFRLLKAASLAYDWDLNLSEIARIWTNGCIIRSSLMQELVAIFKADEPLLLSNDIIEQVKALKPALTRVAASCIQSEIAIPCHLEAINFLNGYAEENSPANLIQAQRDYFGAHSYQRLDDKTGKSYHTNWKNN